MRPGFRPLASIVVAAALATAAAAAQDREPATEAPREPLKVKTETKVIVRDAPKAAREAVEVKIETKVIIRDAMKVAVPPPAMQGDKLFGVPPGVVVQRFNANQAEQFVGQFRAVLRAEYQLLVRVCGPTRDQRREIAQAGERALQVAAAKASAWQLQQQQGRNPAGANGTKPDPAGIIREALADAARAHFTRDQTDLYLREVDLRVDDQERAAVAGLVAKLDQLLLFSPEQREKVAGVLSSHRGEFWWHRGEPWWQSVRAFLQQDQTYPQIPDAYLAPILSPEQRKAWTAAPKAQLVNWSGLTPGMPQLVAPLEDAELAEAPGSAEPDARP